MTEREMLEYAAKAGGVRLDYIDERGGWIKSAVYGDDSYTWTCWNPRDDDGDALRLATELRLNIFHTNGCAYVMHSDCDGELEQKVSYKDAGDKHAATRLAITRAAAEIGKAMT